MCSVRVLGLELLGSAVKVQLTVVLLSELRRCTSARARDRARSSTSDDQNATRLGRESHRCEIDTSRVLHESETEIWDVRQVEIVLEVG